MSLKTEIVFITFYRKLANSGVKVQSRCYPGDLVTRTATGDREIRSVSGRAGIVCTDQQSLARIRSLCE